MAKVKFGAGIADARGSVGSMTFSRNASGAYIREKVTPVNPSTIRQQFIRTVLGDLSKRWATITESQRIGWANLATAFPRTDVFGNPVVISGIAQYQASNIVTANIDPLSVNTIDEPPPNLDVPPTTFLSVALDSATRIASIAFTPSPLVDSGRVYVFATPAISAGVTFVKNRLRFAGAGEEGGATPSTVTLPASLGPLVTGSVVTFEVAAAVSATGALSPFNRFKVVAT